MIIYTVDHNFVLDQLIEKINLKDQKTLQGFTIQFLET